MLTKQVLVWRNDLRNKDGHKVRTGKIAAQLAHASMVAIFDEAEKNTDLNILSIPYPEHLKEWFEDKFTKICVGVNSEEELLAIYQNAKTAGLFCSLIKDAGLTEFKEPTFTAVAVGPANNEDVDKITGHLKLL